MCPTSIYFVLRSLDIGTYMDPSRSGFSGRNLGTSAALLELGFCEGIEASRRP